MNREIKFRAWCESNKEMYMPDGVYEFWLDNNSVGFHPRYDKESLYDFSTIPSEHEKEIVVMQYTGLKDKNRKEIYEGDICKAKFRTASYNHDVEGRIFMDEFMWCLDGKEDVYSINRLNGIEIIGNIYEHPELLK